MSPDDQTPPAALVTTSPGTGHVSTAVYAAREYSRQHGPTARRKIVTEVLPEHPLGYDLNGVLNKVQASDRYGGAWWRRVVKLGLKSLPNVEAPERDASEWRHQK